MRLRTRSLLRCAVMLACASLPVVAGAKVLQQQSEAALRAALEAQRDAMEELARALSRATSLPRGARDSAVRELSGKLQAVAKRLDALDSSIGRFDEETQHELRQGYVRVADAYRAALAQQRILVFENVSITTRPRGRLGVSLSGTQTLTVRDGTVHTTYRTAPVISSVEPGSPASVAGCEAGDTIVAMGGVTLPGEVSLTEMLVPGRRVPLRLRRNGGERTVNVTVGTSTEARAEAPRAVVGITSTLPSVLAPARAPRTPSTPPSITIAQSPCAAGAPCARGAAAGTTISGFAIVPSGADTWSVAGAEMTSVSEDLADLVGRSDGVLLLRVAPGSPAHESGLRGGDVIIASGDTRLTSPRSVQRLVMVANARGERMVELRVSRQRRERALTLRW
jgi:S1-C subfamily serine protease